MDRKTYCRSMADELVGWKARVYDLRRELDKMESSGLQSESTPRLMEMCSSIETLESTIDALNRECPEEWSAARGDIEEQAAKLRSTWEELTLSFTKEAPYNA